MTAPVTPGFSFRTEASDGHARVGRFTTPHFDVETPTFMPVGTQGSVKGLSPAEVESTGAQIVLGNTYHLWLRPGPELIAKLGGLHGFTKWPRAMLTDSGGFQAFSLAQEGPRTAATAGKFNAGAKISEEGVVFRSHLDGSRHAMTPETSMLVQGQLGADVSMQLDECTPLSDEKVRDRAALEGAVARTTRWAKRCLDVWNRDYRHQQKALFGIVQGGTFVDLRIAHAEELAALDFDGLALGGFSVGEPIPMMYEALAEVAHRLDAERPRYLMGVGTPLDLLEGVEHGVDLFDCVLPTRNARNGQALTRFGKVNIKQARFREDPRPLDEACGCACCAGGYARAYLRHLFVAGEMLVLRLLSIHNLWTYGALMREARAAIREGRYAAFKRSWIEGWNRGVE